MIEQARISVVIPAREHEPYLEEAIRSALAERPLEVLVVTPASGASARAAAELGARVLDAGPVGGEAQPRRNLGAHEARGELLAFLDADDIFPVGRTTALRDALGDVALGLVRGFISPDRSGEFGSGEGNLALGVSRAPLSGTALIRREHFIRLGGFNEELLAGEFADWLVRAEDEGLEVSRIDHVVLDRRLHRRGHVLENLGDGIGASYLRLARDRILRSRR